MLSIYYVDHTPHLLRVEYSNILIFVDIILEIVKIWCTTLHYEFPITLAHCNLISLAKLPI
jgi:hypothetical protein